MNDMRQTIFDLHDTGSSNGRQYPLYVMDQIMEIYDKLGGLLVTPSDGELTILLSEATHVAKDLIRDETTITANIVPLRDNTGDIKVVISGVGKKAGMGKSLIIDLLN